LGRVEGIFCGGSAGTIFAAAMKAAKDLDESAVMVFIVCDTGEHYLSKHHSDEWMKEKLMLEPQKITAGLIVETKHSGAPKELFFASPNETVGEVLARMSQNGVTQMPVIDGNESVGSIRESRMLARLIEDRNLLDAEVSSVMEPGFPVVESDSHYDEIRNHLKTAPAVLLREFNRITGIITRSDVLDIQA